MKSVLLTVSVIIIFSVGCLAATSDILLSKDGKPFAAIVVPSDAIPAEQTAAKELASHLKMVTGADFPIVASSKDASQRTRIFIGQTKTTKQLMPKYNFAKIGKDGIVIRKAGNDLILAGDRPRGTLYAVYTFLEDTVGCKWWTAQSNYIPNRPTLRVQVTDLTYAPPFMCRETYYKNVIGENPEFCTKLKLNGHTQPIPAELGGHYSIIGSCHTFYQLIPPSEYFADHPEWFTEVNGKHIHENAQLCPMNEELRKELTKNVLEWIKKNPEAGIVDVSQNDNCEPCRCAKCYAVYWRTGSPSGPLISLVNAVAEGVEKEYPGFMVETLAYQYTRKPPVNIKLRQNVVVRLCSIECDFSKPLTHPANAEFYNDLMGWKAISPKLYVWDYTVGFGNLMMPNPNFRVLAPNIRLFAKSNVIGLFEQGDGYNRDADFAAMKTWLFAHLMWNPNADESKLMNEFLNGYYGPAGEYLRKYIDLICNAIEVSKQPLPWNNTDYTYLTPNVLLKASKLFDAAEKAIKGNDELLKRVELQRAAVNLAIVLNTPGPGLPSGKELEQVLDKFMTTSDQTGNIYRQEGIVMSTDYREQLKEKAAGMRLAVVVDAVKAESMAGYSDAETFAELRKTMTEIFDFPKNGWKFMCDKSSVGSQQGWYLANFDDSSWHTISIGKFVEEQIGPYDGLAWYRISFIPPAIDPGKHVYLAFGAADNAATVWLNGVYMGDREVRSDVPFTFGITQMLRPGQTNTLAVKVNDRGGMGGLWKSIKLMVK